MCLLYCLSCCFKVVFQLTDEDQERYKDFDMVVSARWQEEMCGQLVSHHLTDREIKCFRLQLQLCLM